MEEGFDHLVFKLFELRDSLSRRIAEIIGYSSDDEIFYFEDHRESSWDISCDDVLRVWEADDYEEYTICSYSAKGEQLFMGEDSGLVFVLGHLEHKSYRDARILVLDSAQKRVE